MNLQRDPIWDLIQTANKTTFKDIEQIQTLESALQKKITSRYSGFSGAIIRIYDWLIGNIKIINNAKFNIANKKIMVLKKQTEILKKINSLTQKSTKTNNEPRLDQQSYQKNQETEISKLQKEKDALIEQLQAVQQKQIVLSGAFERTDATAKKLTELVKKIYPPITKIGDCCLSVGVMPDGRTGFIMEVGFPKGDKIILERFYHTDLSTIATIQKNLAHILINKKCNICLKNEKPTTGNCIGFEYNRADYFEDGMMIKSFDLTKPLSQEELDKCYTNYSLKKVELTEKLGLEKNDNGILLALQQQEEEEEDPTRTSSSVQMFKQITQKNGHPAYVNEKLQVGTQSWASITSSVAQACDGPFASMGSTVSREICTVDYQKSKAIQDIYGTLKKAIETERADLVSKGSYNPLIFEQFILQTTMEQVKTAFNLTRGGADIEQILKEERDKASDDAVFLGGHKMPLIPLDTFIAKKIGICRHRAMLFLVLASQLKKDNLLLGEVRQVRGLVRGGAHSWNLYCSPMMNLESGEYEKQDPDIYLIDPMWNNFLSLTLTSDGYRSESFSGYLTESEDTIQYKLKKHIKNLLKKQNGKLTIFSQIGKKDISTQKFKVHGFKKNNTLIISESSSRPDIFVLFFKKSEINNATFFVPKKDVNEELLKHCIEELSDCVTDASLKNFYDKYVKKTGGTLLLLRSGKMDEYRGS